MSKILIDYHAPDCGRLCPPPLMITISGKMFTLTGGINVVDQATLTALAPHKVVTVPTIERKNMDGLIDLIGRTWSDAGLDALAEAESSWYGDKPRKAVADALASQRGKVKAHADALAEKKQRVAKPSKAEPKAERPTKKLKDEPKPEESKDK